MKKYRIKEIIAEELLNIKESITRNFAKAVEALKTIQLKQQQLRKAFVEEKNVKKKEKLKKDLIKLHKKVQQAEKEFNRAILNEPIEDIEQ